MFERETYRDGPLTSGEARELLDALAAERVRNARLNTRLADAQNFNFGWKVSCMGTLSLTLCLAAAAPVRVQQANVIGHGGASSTFREANPHSPTALDLVLRFDENRGVESISITIPYVVMNQPNPALDPKSICPNSPAPPHIVRNYHRANQHLPRR